MVMTEDLKTVIRTAGLRITTHLVGKPKMAQVGGWASKRAGGRGVVWGVRVAAGEGTFRPGLG